MVKAFTDLDRLAEMRLLIFGDVMLDRYLAGRVDRISPEAPVPVVAVEDTIVVAGGAANVAANVIGLGSNCTLVGLVGRDEYAETLLEECADLGIDVNGMVRSDDRQTTVKSRLMSDGHQIARFDQEAIREAGEDESRSLTNALQQEIVGCDGLIISDYGKGVVSEGICTKAIELALELNIPIFVDPKGTDYQRYRGAYVVTPNQKEALEAVVGLGNPGGSVEKAGLILKETYRFENLLVTRGADGMSLFSSDGSHWRVSSTARTVFDVTGAGDTVIATLGVARSAGFELSDAVSIANSAAGIVVESVGTTAIDLSTLKKHLESEGVLRLEADV